MSLTYSDVLDARRVAQETINNADSVARQAARLIEGRLRIARVDDATLATLKAELRDFNAVTKRWKPLK